MEACEVKAKRDNKGKPGVHRLPYDTFLYLSLVYDMGEEKYPRPEGDPLPNWAYGCEYSVNYASLMRHMFKWWSGVDNDAESNLRHLAHAAFCILTLLTYALRGIGQDDRPKIDRSKASRDLLDLFEEPKAK